MLGSLLVLALAAAPGRALPVDGPAIVMLWAPWCAPCREEVRRYPELSAAAAPVPVYVVALDTPIGRRALLRSIPRERLLFETRPSIAVLPHWSPDTAGLPTTFAVDARNRRCASVGRSLNVERLVALIKACGFRS